MKEDEVNNIENDPAEKGEYTAQQIQKMASIASGAVLGDEFKLGKWTGNLDLIGITAEATLYRTITNYMNNATLEEGKQMTLPDLVDLCPELLMQCAVPILASHYRQAELHGRDLPPFGATPAEIMKALDADNTANLSQLMNLVFGTLKLQDTGVLLGKIFALVGTLLSISMGAGAIQSSAPPKEPLASA